MPASNLVKIKVDTSELLEYTKRLRAAERVTGRAIALSLNNVGDSMVAVLATNLSRDTGLSLEQVRGLIKVRRASRSNLAYDVSMADRLLTPEAAQLEGKRERGDFGKREPGEMVVIKTKGDELVCMDCEELQAAGPMPIETAMEHIPKHPHCRCVIMPYVSKKRLPVTMTTVSGTSSRRRSGPPLDQNATLRQLAQDILNQTSRDIRIELK